MHFPPLAYNIIIYVHCPVLSCKSKSPAKQHSSFHRRTGPYVGIGLVKHYNFTVATSQFNARN